ncbi:hypothetical protein UFOVP609_8 [uncultured Caudovirales phage]|uniref:Uncharacterized protein n=1 Tax=uncultured Caudovirales phage TaxID=2100421 RepID=A0A6J5N566_9CAUD|nr:hypothetical protein UFOVP609_8 [uncultured Caudovirales phage]
MAKSRIAEAYVQIVPSLDGIGTKLNSQLSGELGKAGDAAGGNMARSVGNGFGSKIKSVLGPALLGAGVLATVALGKFAKDSIAASSDFAEAGAAIDQVFGKASESIKGFAETGATQLGQSKTQVLDAAKSFGILGKAAGLAGEDNAAFSTDLVQLATDLASFNNTSVDEAILALSSGLRGEAEPLRRFGVLLDDAALKAQAMKMGIYDGNGSLTQQQKVLAANAAIFAQTATQQGDFARTSDGLANSQRTLTAEMENLKITAGSALAPAFTLLVQAISPVIAQLGPIMTQVLAALAPALANLAAVFPQIISALMPLLPVFAQLVGFLTDLLVAILPPLAAVLEVVGEAFSGAFEWITNNVATFATFVGILGGYVAVMNTVRIATAAWAAIQGVLNAVMAINPIMLVVIAIAALVAAIVYIATKTTFFQDAWKAMSTFVVNAWNAAVSAISKGIDAAVQFFTSLPGKVLNALKGFGSMLFDFGKNLIQGLLDGAGSLLKNIGSFFLDMLPGWITGPFKAALGIASPSKVFKGFGKDIMKGLEKGLMGGESSIKSTMDKVSSWITQKLEAGEITKKGAQAARALVRVYTKELTKLTREHDKIVARLEKAQEELAARLEEKLSFIQDISQQYGAGYDLNEEATAATAIAGLQERIAKAQELQDITAQLQAMGLNKDLYRQIVEAGAVDFAKSIIAGGSEAVAQLNVLADQANTEAQKLAAQVGAVLFDEGIKFAQSVVDGLLKEEQQITSMMERVAAKFASRLEAIIANAISQMNSVRASSSTANPKASTPAPSKKSPAPVKSKSDSFFATKKALNMIGSGVAKSLPYTPAGISNKLRAMAAGGFVTKPTRALIGEAGPEVVTPLKDFERMMGLDGGSGKTINYYAAPNKSLDSERELFQAIKRAEVIAGW